MKKMNLLFAVTLLLGISILAACKKEKIMTYDAFNNIYFNYMPSNNLTDSVDVTFAYSPLSVTDSTFMIPIKVTGAASSNDRVYNVKVDTGTTAVAGKHFTLPATFVFHANKYIDSLPVKLLRTADEQTQVMSIRLTLQPSDALHTDLKLLNTNIGDAINVNSFKIRLSDQLVQNAYWGSFSPYFGTFSAKKIRLINQVTGMPLNYITLLVGLYDTSMGPRCGVWAVAMTNYLNQQNAEGHTVYEDDGVTPMAMAPAYQ